MGFSGKIGKLNKSRYGLKQASREWYETFNESIKNLSFVAVDADQCLYVYVCGKVNVYILLYVDNIIMAGNDEIKIDEIKTSLMNKFKIKDLGELRSFLGIKITKIDEGMFLNQRGYLERLLNRFGMSECKPVNTPMEAKFNESEESSNLGENVPYRELMGCLLYVTQTTRPDLCYAVNYLSRFQSNTKEIHWKALKRVL